MKHFKKFLLTVAYGPIYFLGFVPFSGIIYYPLEDWRDKTERELRNSNMWP